MASAAPTQSCVTAMDSAEAASESSFLAQLNDLRRSRNLPALVANHRIAGPAADWSETMSAQDWLHHARDTGPNDGVEPHQDYVTLVTNVVANWQRVGENVGVSTMRSWCSGAELDSATRSATDALHTAFVNSEGHFRNMIGDFNQVGIGVEIDADELWVTVRFAKGDLPPEASYTAEQQAEARGYIDAVYQLFVNRAATSAEHQRWTPTVLEGKRRSLTAALSVSDEWAGERIEDLYQVVLGRSADDSGRAAWLSAVRGGKRLEDVAAGFFGSQEYFNRSGGTNDRFVRSLYEDILGRSADNSGREFWTGAIQRGMTRRQVAANFYASIESRRDRVTALYQEILSRNPDSTGMQHWSTQLRSMGDVVLASTLASSTEFWNRATA